LKVGDALSSVKAAIFARSTTSQQKYRNNVMEMDYIWAALAINFLLVWLVPKIFKGPTGIQVLDDIVLYLNSQNGFIISSSIVLAFVVYGAHKWIDSTDVSIGPTSPHF